MGKPFEKVHASAVGTFNHDGDKIPQWIRANGGKFSKDICKDVTHLIATKEAYKRNCEAVQQAKRLKTIKIVSYDWLEDSLLSKTRRPKREGPYLLESILKKEKKAARTVKRVKKSRKRTGAADSLDAFVEECLPATSKTEACMRQQYINVGRDDGMLMFDPVNYHVYSDPRTGVTFDATLVRPSALPNSREKFHMKVYESNSLPHTYAAYARYSRVGKVEANLLAPPGSRLDIAMTAFKRFFLLQTGHEWDDRSSQAFPMPKTDSEGKILPAHQGWFRYENHDCTLASFMRQGLASSALQDDEH